MIPPEAVARLILFVGPAILVGMWWNSHGVERERIRLSAINALTSYVERRTPERLSILEMRLEMLGIKGKVSEVSDKDMIKLAEYLTRKDLKSARKFVIGAILCLTMWPLFGNLVCS